MKNACRRTARRRKTGPRKSFDTDLYMLTKIHQRLSNQETLKDKFESTTKSLFKGSDFDFDRDSGSLKVREILAKKKIEDK